MNGDLVRKIGSCGLEPGQLDFPYGLVIDNEGRINSRISGYSQTSDFFRCLENWELSCASLIIQDIFV